MGKFIIRQTPTGFKFDLKAANGESIATSEVYSTKSVCRKGIASVCKNAPNARLEDQTSPGCKMQTNPKFEIYEDKAGQFRFRLKARNGEVIASSEGYSQKAGCLGGVESVRKNVVDAKIIEELD